MKNFLKGMVLACALFMGVINVQAANWYQLWKEGDEITWYVDIDSISKNTHGYEEAWFKRQEENKAYNLIHYGFHRTPKEIALLGGVHYGPDGKVVGTFNNPWYALDWNSIIPESNGEGFHMIVYTYLDNKKD